MGTAAWGCWDWGDLLCPRRQPAPTCTKTAAAPSLLDCPREEEPVLFTKGMFSGASCRQGAPALSTNRTIETRLRTQELPSSTHSQVLGLGRISL